MKTFEAYLSRGWVGGFDLTDGLLQIGLLKIVVQINFNNIADGLKRFKQCFVEN